MNLRSGIYPLILLIASIAIIGCSRKMSLDDGTAGRVDAAIEKARIYFESNYAQIDRADVLMILSILNEEFGLGWNVHAASDEKPHLADQSLKFYDRYFQGRDRIELDEKVKAQFAAGDTDAVFLEMENLTVLPMFCRDHPLPNGYFEYASTIAELDEISAVHGLLQGYHIARWGCDLPRKRARQFTDSMAQVISVLMTRDTLTKKQDYLLDFRLECIAFLLYSGRHEYLGPEHLEAVLTGQLDPGGWPKNYGEAVPNSHASLLGLWALLEWRREFLK